jgi:hypothetical protein
MKRLLLLLFLVSAVPVFSQTMYDGLMMPAKSFCTGFMYTNDQWHEYWEGGLKRDNLNLGSVTTQSLMYYGVYGLNSRVNIIGSVPYVWTKASAGTLTGLQGVQDVTVAAKYNFIKQESTNGKFKAFLVGSFSTPLTDYTPDFLPLSIGMASTNVSGRFTANYSLARGWYGNGSAGYTYRGNVKLDRPAYYTDGQYFSTDEVKMPDVFDYIVNFGYSKKAFRAEIFYAQQNTLGGGDIRRQDMPFVSNRMNFSKVGTTIMYYLSKPKNFVLRGVISETVSGRNVGQTFSYQLGILYTFNFNKDVQSTNE